MNRQVYQEGTSIFYGENLFIRLVTNVKKILNLYHKVGVQPIARGERVGNFERGAMTMTITKDGDNRKEESFEVFACDDLDVWCYGLSARILASSGIPASRIAVSIHGSSEGRIHELRNSAPSALSKSGRLLEPFTKFHSFRDLANLNTYDVFCAMCFQVQSDLVAVLFETNHFDDCCYWARTAIDDQRVGLADFCPRLEDFAMVVFHHFFACKARGVVDRAAVWGLEEVVVMLKEELVVLDRKLEVMRQHDLTTSL